jgi:hypothetical protein
MSGIELIQQSILTSSGDFQFSKIKLFCATFITKMIKYSIITSFFEGVVIAGSLTAATGTAAAGWALRAEEEKHCLKAVANSPASFGQSQN